MNPPPPITEAQIKELDKQVDKAYKKAGVKHGQSVVCTITK